VILHHNLHEQQQQPAIVAIAGQTAKKISN